MKVVVLAHFESIEGSSIANVVCKTALAFAELGHRVTVLLPCELSFPELTDRPDIRFIASPSFLRGGFSLRECLWRIAKIRSIGPDSIYVYRGHRPSALIPTIVARFWFNIPCQNELWERYDWKGIGRTRKGMGRLVALYDQLFDSVALSCFNRTIAINNYLFERARTRTEALMLPGATDTRNLKIHGMNEARKKLGLPENKILIGLSNVDVNDLEDLTQFKNAWNKLENGDVALVLSGSSSSAVLEVFGGRGISLGWLSYEDYSVFLSAMDLFFIPYPPTERNLGRWPNKLGDYQFFGKKTITNPSGHLKDEKDFESPYYIFCADEEEEYSKVLSMVIQRDISFSVKSGLPSLTFEQRAARILEISERL